MGLAAANDKLPKALLQPFPDGGSAGYVPDVERMLRAYYEARGWDAETGKPSRGKLSELGLNDVAKDLWVSIAGLSCDLSHPLLTAVRFMVRRTPGFGNSATPMTVRAGR